MNDQNGRYTRIRYALTGALAALAMVGAIAGTAALAAGPPTKARARAALANANQQPFLDAVQRLVDDGTISATQGQALDSEIRSGRLDMQTLASSGVNQAQLQAVQQTLENTKRALASAVAGAAPTTKAPPPSGPCAPGGGKGPTPAAQGNNGTQK